MCTGHGMVVQEKVIHPFTHLITYSLTHSLTHSLTCLNYLGRGVDAIKNGGKIVGAGGAGGDWDSIYENDQSDKVRDPEKGTFYITRRRTHSHTHSLAHSLF